MTMTIAFVLVGMAAIAAGALGIRLPTADRLAAGLSLVVGAGVGVVVLAIGSQLVDDSSEAYERVFLVASALGFVATLAALVLLRRRVASDQS